VLHPQALQFVEARVGRPALQADLRGLLHDALRSLGGLLELPMGRARYLMQTLAYRHGRLLRERRAEHIRGALEAAEEDEQGRPFVVIDPGCRDVFDRTARALHAENKISSGLKGEVVLEGVRYEMGEGHLEALKEAFAAKEDGTGRE
jgi:hypothetical protein